MRKLIKSLTAVSVSLLLCVGGVPALAAARDAETFINVTFNDQPTNAVNISGLTVSGGKACIDVPRSNDKALYMEPADSVTKVVGAFEPGDYQDMVCSVDIMKEQRPVNLTLSLASDPTGNSTTDVLKIVNSELRTMDNKRIGGLSGGVSNISIVIKDNSFYDIYLDYNCVLFGWKMPSNIKAKSFVITQSPLSACYLDNFRVYGGNDVRSGFPTSFYNPERQDNIGVTYFAGDMTFFDNRFAPVAGDGKTAYRTNILSSQPKTNRITYSRLQDTKSPNRKDYIYMERFDTSNDCYFDINCRVTKGMYADSMVYSYYKMEGDFKIDKLGSLIQFPLVRDSDSASTLITAIPFFINAGGDITFSGGSVSGAVKEGEWFHFLAFFNMQTNTADAYLNGVQIAKNVPLTQGMKRISMMRIALASGDSGDLYIDNFNITGLQKPIVDGVETKTSIMPSETEVKDFLGDKIAFGVFGNLLCKDGEKIELTKKAIYDKDTLQFYVPVETLNAAFDMNLRNENGRITGGVTVTKEGALTLEDGTEIQLDYTPKEQDGELYIPFAQFGTVVSGKYAWSFETGILLFSDYELNMQTDSWAYLANNSEMASEWHDIDHLSNYLQYIRPDAERLKADYLEHTGDETMSQHPRLILTAEDFSEHRRHYEAKDDPYYMQIAQSIIEQADKYLIAEMAHYTFLDAMRGSMYGFRERFTAWGYAYHMTGDRKYVDAALEQFRIIDEEMPDFNESHILDAGQALRGLAIGYDWFYNAFTPEQKDGIAEMIMKKGLERLGGGLFGRLPTSDYTINFSNQFKARSNITGIIDSGIIDAAVAIMEYAPEECFAYIAEATRSLEYCMVLLAPDGGWPESPHYYNYAMESVVWGTAALESAFGQSYGLMDGQGMDNTIRWALSLFGNAEVNNYGDSAPSTEQSFSTFNYFGKRNADRAALYARKRDVESGNQAIAYEDLIFYDFANADAGPNDLAALGKVIQTDGVEMVTFRDTFDFDASNFFFSAHFGTTSGYHQHNDCGTFVLDMLGERWALDIGKDDYNLENAQGYKDWMIFRKRAESHNVMVLNPAGHSDGYEMQAGRIAPIIAAEANDYGGYVYADMDDVYQEASSMTLGYYIDDNMNSVTMRNEYTLEQDTSVYWFMETKAKPVILGDTLFLAQNGKTIKLEFLSGNGSGIWEVTAAQPLPSSPQVPEQNPNDGISRVALKLDGSQGENNLVVKISPASMITKKISDVPFSEWKLPEKSDLQTIDLNTNFEVYSNGETIIGEKLAVIDGVMPEISVVTEDPEAIVEIDEARNVTDVTTVVVWDSSKTSCNVRQLEYMNVYTSQTSIQGYQDLPIFAVDVSSTPEALNHKYNMLDYNSNTRWTCLEKGSWAVFDTGSLQEIDAVALAFWKGDVRSYYYDIQVSTDGENWTPVRTEQASSGTTDALELCEFDAPVTARYVRFVGNGNSEISANINNSNILEFRALKKIN